MSTPDVGTTVVLSQPHTLFGYEPSMATLRIMKKPWCTAVAQMLGPT